VGARNICTCSRAMESADEKSKAEAADAFEKLGVCRQLAVSAADLGWKSPTSIQEQAVPHLLAGRPPRSRLRPKHFASLRSAGERSLLCLSTVRLAHPTAV